MATTKRSTVSRVSVSVNPNQPRKQNADMVQKLVKQALGRAGCDGCGRIAYIDLGFLIDPVDKELGDLGAIAMDVTTR
jgi:hypothetical protein